MNLCTLLTVTMYILLLMVIIMYSGPEIPMVASKMLKMDSRTTISSLQLCDLVIQA
jgi:hypothetical protein